MNTIDSLLARALVVMNETKKRLNTATRVGSLFRDILLFLQNAVLGIILKGEKDNEAAIKAIASPSRGDTYKATDSGHYWTYDGTTWNDVGEVIPNDVATQDDIARLASETSVFNVTENVPLESGYYTADEARAAVPANIRKKGLTITYAIDATTWITEQFYRGAVSAWTNVDNWIDIQAVNYVSNSALGRAFIKQLYLYGNVDKANKMYWIRAIARNNATYKWSIIIGETDLDGASNYRIVSYLYQNPAEPDTVFKIPSYSSSGIDAYAIVDWNAVPDGSNTSYSWILNANIFDPSVAQTCAEQLKLEPLNDSLSTLSGDMDNLKPLSDSFVGVGVYTSVTELWKKSQCSYQNETSSFSGWGFYIGKYQNFNAVTVNVKNRDTKNLTKCRLRLYDNDSGSIVLADKTVNVNIAPGANADITVVFGETIKNTDNVGLFLTYQCDALVSRFGLINNSLYSYVPADDVSYPRHGYFTGGNLNTNMSKNAATSTITPYYYKIGVAKLEMMPNDDVLKYIEENLIIDPETVITNETDVSIFLPNEIIAVVGDTLQLYYSGMFNAVNSYMYGISIICSKGKQFPRYFEYIPTASDVGSVNFKVQLRRNGSSIIAEKTVTLKTVAAVKQPLSNTKILALGASATSNGYWAAEMYRRLTESGGTPAGLGFGNIEMVGRVLANGVKIEATGGWRWADYAGTTRAAFRFVVTGATNLSLNAVYSNNGYSYTIREINVTNGNGNILCNVSNSSQVPESSGTLTRVSGSGQDTITFTSSSPDTQNPFWNSETNQLDFISYANEYCGGNIDVIYTECFGNGSSVWQTDFTNRFVYVKTFLDALHEQLPNCKMVIGGMWMPSRAGGMGSNYGAAGGWSEEYGMRFTFLNLVNAIQEFINKPEYSDWVSMLNWGSEFDPENNYPSIQKPVNIRSSITEKLETNGVHPITGGYYQMGDSTFRHFVANFCQ